MYEAISTGCPERMGVPCGWSVEKFPQKSRTTLPSGKVYKNLCWWRGTKWQQRWRKPPLRDAANVCFRNAEARFQSPLDYACKTARKPAGTASLAALWIATIQGSRILFKASRDASVILRNLEHVKQYIGGFLPRRQLRRTRNR